MSAVFLFLILLVPADASDLAQAPRYVALTFDDGPSAKCTQPLLDGLAARGVHCTFFVCGYRVRENPKLVSAIITGGHELGLHGDTHDYMNAMDSKSLQLEIAEPSAYLQETTGVTPHLLRPPGGLYNDAVRAEAQRQQLPIILWEVDPLDWACHKASEVTRRITAKAADGDIILMHDSSASSVSAALRTIDLLQARGFVFVTVSELAAQKGVALCPGQPYSHIS